MTRAEALAQMTSKYARGSARVGYFQCARCKHLRPLAELVEQQPTAADPVQLVCADTAWCDKARGGEAPEEIHLDDWGQA